MSQYFVKDLDFIVAVIGKITVVIDLVINDLILTRAWEGEGDSNMLLNTSSCLFST